MDLDFTRLSPEETKKRQEAGLCFRCREKGHIGRNCPTNRKKAGSPAAWRREKIAVTKTRALSPVTEATYYTTEENQQEDFRED